MAGGIQETVYQVDVGYGRIWVARAFLTLLSIGIALYFTVGEFRGFAETEAMDFAVTAREIARGNGFSTRVLKPLGLSRISQREQSRTGTVNPKIDVVRFPDIYNPPVYPAVLAGAFKLMRTDFKPKLEDFRNYRIYKPEWVIVIFSQICVLLSVILVNSLATNLFDRRVGLLAGVLFLFCDLLWKFSISGLSTSWVMLLLLFTFWATNRAFEAHEEDRTASVWGWMLLSGVTLGLAILSRYAVAWLLPAYLLTGLIVLRTRLVIPIVAILVSVLVVAPWLVRNQNVSGNFLGGNLSLINSSEEDRAGKDLLRSFRSEDGAFSLKNVVKKQFIGWQHYANRGWELLGGSLLTGFFIVSLLHGFKRERVRCWRLFSLLGLISFVLGTSFFYAKPSAVSEHNNIVLLLPLVVIFGCAMFYVTLDRLETRVEILRKMLQIGFGIACSLPFILTLLPPSAGFFQYPPYHPAVINILAGVFEPEEVICSDISSGISWYGDRTTVDFPYRMSDYLRINDYVTYMSGVLLTPESMNQPLLLEVDKGKYKDWATALHRQRVPDGFPLTFMNQLPPNQNEYLLMTDRVRTNL